MRQPTAPAPITATRSPFPTPPSQTAFSAVSILAARTARAGGTASGTDDSCIFRHHIGRLMRIETENGLLRRGARTGHDPADIRVSVFDRAWKGTLLERRPHGFELACRHLAAVHQALGAAADAGVKRFHEHLAFARRVDLDRANEAPIRWVGPEGPRGGYFRWHGFASSLLCLSMLLFGGGVSLRPIRIGGTIHDTSHFGQHSARATISIHKSRHYDRYGHQVCLSRVRFRHNHGNRPGRRHRIDCWAHRVHSHRGRPLPSSR